VTANQHDRNDASATRVRVATGAVIPAVPFRCLTLQAINQVSHTMALDLEKEVRELDRDDTRGLELTSGDVCDVQVGGHWIRTRIEFLHAPGGGDYYAVERGVRLCRGLPARTVG
jgi:hypothetical protein